MTSQLADDGIERDLSFAAEIARDAGRRALAQRECGRWEGQTLADVGDHAADGYLQGCIRGRYPEDAILSEETADSPERLGKERVWIVDPIDGTREYSQLRDDWAVHVGLCVGGVGALGAVALPAVDTVLWGVALEGRERSGHDGNGRAAVRGDSAQTGAPRILVSRSRTPSWIADFAGALEGELVPFGSVGFKASRLLLGEADVYVCRQGLNEWDTCAPEIVARAFGWHVCTMSGESHVYNRPNPRNHELVICRPAWRERVLEAAVASGALRES